MNKRIAIIGMKDTFTGKRYIVTDMEGDIKESLIPLEKNGLDENYFAYNVPKMYLYPENTFVKNKVIYGHEWIIMKVDLDANLEKNISNGIIENIDKILFYQDVDYGVSYAKVVIKTLLKQGETEKALSTMKNILENQTYFKMGKGDVTSYLTLIEKHAEMTKKDVNDYLFPLTKFNMGIYPYLLKKNIDIDYAIITKDSIFGFPDKWVHVSYTENFTDKEYITFHQNTALAMDVYDKRLEESESYIRELLKNESDDYVYDNLPYPFRFDVNLRGKINGDELLNRFIHRFTYFLKNSDKTKDDISEEDIDTQSNILQFIFLLISYKSFLTINQKFDADKVKTLILELDSKYKL